MVNIPKLIKGSALCIGGTIPFAVSGYVPKKLKIVPYLAGLGVESYGLWEIYKSFTEEGGWSANVEASNIRELVNLYWHYPSWHQEISCDSIPLTGWQGEVRWTTEPEINDYIPDNWNDIGGFIFALLYDLDAEEAFKLAVYPGMWPLPNKFVIDIALYYPSNPSNLPFKYPVPYERPPFGLNKSWLCKRKNHRFVIKFYITDHLEYPHEVWWFGTAEEGFSEHIIAQALGSFKLI